MFLNCVPEDFLFCIKSNGGLVYLLLCQDISLGIKLAQEYIAAIP